MIIQYKENLNTFFKKRCFCLHSNDFKTHKTQHVNARYIKIIDVPHCRVIRQLNLIAHDKIVCKQETYLHVMCY